MHTNYRDRWHNTMCSLTLDVGRGLRLHCAISLVTKTSRALAMLFAAVVLHSSRLRVCCLILCFVSRLHNTHTQRQQQHSAAYLCSLPRFGSQHCRMGFGCWLYVCQSINRAFHDYTVGGRRICVVVQLASTECDLCGSRTSVWSIRVGSTKFLSRVSSW